MSNKETVDRLVERMRATHQIWDDAEPRDDWWQEQREHLEAADLLAQLALTCISQEERIAELEEKAVTLQFLLARYGDRIRMANAIVPSWQQEIDEALEGRCTKCGGLHKGGDCNGPPTPSVPHPHSGRMMG